MNDNPTDLIKDLQAWKPAAGSLDDWRIERQMRLQAPAVPPRPDDIAEPSPEEQLRLRAAAMAAAERKFTGDVRAMLAGGFPARAVQFIASALKAGDWPEFPQANVFGRVVDALDDRKTVLLLGDHGPGKTTLATQAVWVLIKRAGDARPDVRYHKAMGLIDHVRHRTMQGHENPERVIAELGRVPVLVIDEMQLLRDTDDEMLILDRVFDARYDAMTPTVLISNHVPAEFDSQIARRRNKSRWSEVGERIICNWRSFRAPAPSAPDAGNKEL